MFCKPNARSISFAPTIAATKFDTMTNSLLTAGAAVQTKDTAPSAAQTGSTENSADSSRTNGPTANGVHRAPGREENGNAEADTAASAVPDADGWMEGQVAALVAAMKKFGKGEEDRWSKIAAAVPGKTPSQCVKRFKSLRDTVRAKKAADS